MLSNTEQRVLGVFSEYLVSPGQMLCFHGPQLAKYKSALRQLSDKGYVIKEDFRGGYSLTRAGFAAMKDCAT